MSSLPFDFRPYPTVARGSGVLPPLPSPCLSLGLAAVCLQRDDHGRQPSPVAHLAVCDFRRVVAVPHPPIGHETGGCLVVRLDLDCDRRLASVRVDCNQHARSPVGVRSRLLSCGKRGRGVSSPPPAVCHLESTHTCSRCSTCPSSPRISVVPSSRRNENPTSLPSGSSTTHSPLPPTTASRTARSTAARISSICLSRSSSFLSALLWQEGEGGELHVTTNRASWHQRLRTDGTFAVNQQTLLD